MKMTLIHDKRDKLKGESICVRLVNRLMRSYELGQLKIGKHDVEKLTEALGISNERFEYIVNLARDAWDHEDTISESIEYLARCAEESRDVNDGDPISGSELVLAYVFFGRIWEDQQEDEQ